MNSITELLNLEDSDIFISDISIQGTTKTLTLETKLYSHYCPSCGYRMHSKGIKNRTIKHPILQDNYELILILKQRRWKCTNPECNYDISDSFKFVNKRRRTTNATDMLIVYAYRDLMETSASIANRFHISDTHVHEIFDRYVKMDRLPLTDAICIDEVYLDNEHISSVGSSSSLINKFERITDIVVTFRVGAFPSTLFENENEFIVIL